MSSAEATTKACSLCLDGTPNLMGAGPEALQQIDILRQEVTRLKCDKLDLLRQNVVSVRNPIIIPRTIETAVPFLLIFENCIHFFLNSS